MAGRNMSGWPPAGPTPDEGAGRVKAKAAAQLAVLVPPWLILGLVAGIGVVSHWAWGTPAEVAWAAVAATVTTTALAGLTWMITHTRRLIGRVHATATVAAAGVWTTVVTITGLGPAVVWGALWFGGAGLALSWNLRSVIRAHTPDDGGSGDALSALFDRAKNQAGLKGARARATEVTDRRVKGVLALPPGEATADDAQRATARLESGMRVPPGTLTITANHDRADLAEITVSDPRVLREPINWPGPSRPGVSIAEPIRIGVWQDGTDCQVKMTGRHLQIMGMTGSGKSIGGAWNILGEAITRPDVAILAIDTSKDEQTLGPISAGLARMETTKPGAVDLLRGLHQAIPARTRWLARHGYSNWETGCGLTYWLVLIEEAPKFIASLSSADEEKLEEIMKEIRSAGGTVILSMQRADYTQIPTLLRSQMGKMCFGLADDADTKFGISARQAKTDTVEPHVWENHYPGMAFLDTAGVDSHHYATPLRTYTWGGDSRTARAAMEAHAAAYPASAKTLDEFTAALAVLPAAGAGPVDTDTETEPEEPTGAVDAVWADAEADPETTDPDPALTATIGPDTPVQQPSDTEDTALTAATPARRSPAEARANVHAWLAHRCASGHRSFKASDPELADVREAMGMGRSWTYKVLAELVALGHLTQDNGTFYIAGLPDDDADDDDPRPEKADSASPVRLRVVSSQPQS